MLPAWRMLVPVVVAILVVGGYAFGIIAEVTRTIPVTDTINDDVEKERAAMGSQLMDLGCEKASLMGRISPTNPSELMLVMTCVKWAEGTTYGPARK